ncbi:MAG: M20/M25/M40 family metallo-hydrolase [Pirellulales bacterium]
MATRNLTTKKRSAPSQRVRSKAAPRAPQAAPARGDAKRAFDMVMQLMAIPGKSGQEQGVADYITRKLRQAGAPAAAIRFDDAHRRTPLKGAVGNLVFQLPGTVRAPRRLLMAHMDTVPICVGSKPVKKGGFVRSANPQSGLGADDRSGVAVTLHAALEIMRRKLPHPPLVFFWPIQEEVGLHGARYAKLNLLGNPRLAFNWDGGSADKITVAATGGYRMRIEIDGLAAHAGAAPERGVSAIAIASLAIADLVRNGWHGLIAKDGDTGTSNVGYIHGGEATNVVTDRVEMKAEARSHNPAFRQRIVREIERAFQQAAAAISSADGQHGAVRIFGSDDYEAFRLADDEPAVLAAERAVRAAGLEPQRAVSNGGLDANWMTAHGIPTVTLGCGQMQIHTTGEMLDLAAFEHACQIALHLATELGSDDSP